MSISPASRRSHYILPQLCSPRRLGSRLLQPRQCLSVRFAASRTPQPELPDDYDPDKGLPFQQHPLSKAEIAKIFGPSADVQLANRSLRILHGRRVAGIIGDAVSFPDPTGYSERFARTALRWLRANHPIDEEMAYNLRLERERREVEEDLIADAERLGIYKPQGGVKDGNVYGESGLDAIREHYERQPVKTKKRPSQVEEIETNTGTVSSVRGRADLRRTDTPEWIKPYIEKAMLTKAEAPPNQSSWRRIWPSAAVAGLVVGLSVFLADHYVPPPRSARLWPDMPPAAATLLAILMANSVVLVAWRIPMAWRFLNRYFLSVPGYPFALSVVGNMFSHQQFTHFAMNMVVLWIMGTRLHDEVGRGNFLAIYFSGGVVGSLFSLVSFVARKNLVTSSLGASGAIASVIASWCCVNSDKKFSFIFLPPDLIPPMSAYTVLAGLVLVEAIGIFRGWGRLDHWAHLGGYVAGAAWAVRLKQGAAEQRRRELQRRRERGLIEKLTTWERGR